MELYHVLNRGVQKCDVVKDDFDRLRFVHSLFVFNNSKPLEENHRRSHLEHQERDILVHLHAWCLMPNHYHMLLSPVNDDLQNLSVFMKKLNMGYARYFNEKYDRSGYLWQGKYKKIHLEHDAHFNYIPYYLHLNPLDLSMPEWRTGGVLDTEKALKDLRQYRWNSHLDYSGNKNFPSVITKELLGDALGTREAYTSNLLSIMTSHEKASMSQMIEK